VGVAVAHDGTTANITLSGPAGAWFGVGFAAGAMADQPYALIVDGAGAVAERKLADHGPGVLLAPSVTVLASAVTAAGVRMVTLSRPVAGASAQHYSLPAAPGAIPLILATGNSAALAYHKAHDAASLTLLATDERACVCAPSTHTYLTYNAPGRKPQQMEYAVNCNPEPRGDMAKFDNPACKMATYQGGLHCCHHQWFLTDTEQDAEHSGPVDKYYLKFRYYFQDYVPATTNATAATAAAATAATAATASSSSSSHGTPASHQHMSHWVFLIDATVNDYEEDPHVAGDGVGKITAHVVVGSTMGIEDAPAGGFSAANFHVMTPHCHAPSCIREELWNADTGEILCNVTAVYGTGINVFNESDYVAIPPCLFGDEPGLRKPWSLAPDTNITAVKYYNNSFRHLGQMAQWTGLLTYTV